MVNRSSIEINYVNVCLCKMSIKVSKCLKKRKEKKRKEKERMQKMYTFYQKPVNKAKTG